EREHGKRKQQRQHRKRYSLPSAPASSLGQTALALRSGSGSAVYIFTDRLGSLAARDARVHRRFVPEARASLHEVLSGFTEISFSMACTLRSTKTTLGISIIAPRSPAAVALRSPAPRPSAARKKSELCFWNRNPCVSKLSAPPPIR